MGNRSKTAYGVACGGQKLAEDRSRSRKTAERRTTQRAGCGKERRGDGRILESRTAHERLMTALKTPLWHGRSGVYTREAKRKMGVLVRRAVGM